MYHIARQLNYHPFPLYRVFLQTRVKWWWSLLCNIIPREGQQIIPHFTTPSNPFLPYMHYAKQAGFSDNMPLPCISISNCPNIASKIYFNLYFTIKTDKVKNSGCLGLSGRNFTESLAILSSAEISCYLQDLMFLQAVFVTGIFSSVAVWVCISRPGPKIDTFGKYQSMKHDASLYLSLKIEY